MGRSNGMNLLVVDLRLVIHSDICWIHLCNFCCFRRCFTVCVPRITYSAKGVCSVRYSYKLHYCHFRSTFHSKKKLSIQKWSRICPKKISDGPIHAFSDSCHFSANSTSWQMLGFHLDSSAWKRKSLPGSFFWIQVDASGGEFSWTERPPPRFEDHQNDSKKASQGSSSPKKKIAKHGGKTAGFGPLSLFFFRL